MYKAQVSAFSLVRVVIAAGLGLWAALAPASESDDAFIPRLINSSTIPSNGDLNPYGVALPSHLLVTQKSPPWDEETEDHERHF